MVKCAACFHENPPDAQYCAKCGGALESFIIKCPNCQLTNSPLNTHCVYCGKRLPPHRPPAWMLSSVTEKTAREITAGFAEPGQPAREHNTSISTAIFFALFLGAVQVGILYTLFMTGQIEIFTTAYLLYCVLVGWLSAHGFQDRAHWGDVRMHFGLTLVGITAPFTLFMAGMYLSRNMK